MVLSQQSLYQASSRKRMYKAPKPKTAHQHFARSSLGSTNGTEWFLPLLWGSEQIKLLAKSSHAYFSLETMAVNLFSPLTSFSGSGLKKKVFAPSLRLCPSLPEHPSRLQAGLQAGLHQTFPPVCIFWPCSGPVYSKDKVQGWRESKYRANTVVWGVTNCRFAKGLIASERQ